MNAEPDDVAGAIEETREVLEEASRLYAPFSCPATAECCHLAVTQRPPWLWPTEWAILEAAVGAIPPARPDGACRLLGADGRCTTYDSRPFGCRTFFCDKRRGPVREPTMAVHRLLDRLTALNVALDPGSAPRQLNDWLEDAVRHVGS